LIIKRSSDNPVDVVGTALLYFSLLLTQKSKNIGNTPVRLGNIKKSHSL